jgi:hypothetical protein
MVDAQGFDLSIQRQTLLKSLKIVKNAILCISLLKGKHSIEGSLKGTIGR